MKKSLYLTFFVSIILVLSACGNNENADAGEDSNTSGDGVTLTMSTLSADGALIHEGYEKFEEVIEEENTNISVDLYANGQLANSDDHQYELVTSGTADVLSVPTSTVSNATGVNALNIFDIPFLFTDLEEMYSVLDGEIGDTIIGQIEENSNVKVLGFLDLGTFSIGNTSQPIEEPQDLNDLRIRSMNTAIHIDTLESFGATPSPIAYGEVYTALEQGTIDGLQTTTSLIYGDRLYEPLNYLTVTRHVPLPHVLMVNQDFYDGLSDEQKESMEIAAEEHIEFARQLSIEEEEVAIQTMEDVGVEVNVLTEEEQSLFAEKTQGVAENNMDMLDEEIYQQILDFLDE